LLAIAIVDNNDNDDSDDNDAAAAPSIAVSVLNLAGAAIALYWVDTDGDTVLLSEAPIQNGTSSITHSFDGHRFMLRYADAAEKAGVPFTKGPAHEVAVVRSGVDDGHLTVEMVTAVSYGQLLDPLAHVYVHPFVTDGGALRHATLLGAAAPPEPDVPAAAAPDAAAAAAVDIEIDASGNIVATPDGSPPSFSTLLPELDRGMRRVASDSTDYCFVHPGIRVAASGEKGLGVFAATSFTAGQLVEVAPALVVPDVAIQVYRGGDTDVRPNVLSDYVYPFPLGRFAPVVPHPAHIVVLGYGMVYNHCAAPDFNVVWETVKLPASMVRKSSHGLTSYAVAFQATRDIQPGEELCWDYGHPYWEGRAEKLMDDAASDVVNYGGGDAVDVKVTG